jgi:hypothetical protein
LKACGVVTAAAAKRNRFISEIVTEISAFRLVLLPMLLVLPSQFIHQMFKTGRRMHGFGAEIPLQPFANGIADRSGGPPVDRLDGFGGSAAHHRVPPVCAR